MPAFAPPTPSYYSAMKKLNEGRGNLLRQVEMLQEAGIRKSKSLPQNLLDAATFDEPGLALAADADESGKHGKLARGSD